MQRNGAAARPDTNRTPVHEPLERQPLHIHPHTWDAPIVLCQAAAHGGVRDGLREVPRRSALLVHP